MTKSNMGVAWSWFLHGGFRDDYKHRAELTLSEMQEVVSDQDNIVKTADSSYVASSTSSCERVRVCSIDTSKAYDSIDRDTA